MNEDVPDEHLLTTAIVETARELAARLEEPGPDTRIGAISLALALNRLADHALHVVVAEARAGGFSWQQIGDITGTTRQGAYQRFGADPPQGLAIRPYPAAESGVRELFASLAQGDIRAVRAQFSKSTAAALSERRLAAAWDHTVTALGAFNGVGTITQRLLGDLTRVDAELHFDAATASARVSYTPDGKIVGLWILSPLIPEFTT
ncbi:MAG: DUF3887 domain-containing protein [Thermomicrobiales bacterium]